MTSVSLGGTQKALWQNFKSKLMLTDEIHYPKKFLKNSTNTGFQSQLVVVFNSCDFNIDQK